MPEKKKKCFVIMPITTPESHHDKYRDKAEHFAHVLECLYVPSVERAGYEIIKPIAKGSENIHVGIIKRLETADLVLCDMSTLNPNVFFELGCRTALNLPVCAVKDEHTPKVPFDVGTIHYHEYKSTLEPWELPHEIEKLVEHIQESEKKSAGENELWKVFGLRATAKPYEGDPGEAGHLSLLSMQIDTLNAKIDRMMQPELPNPNVVDVGGTKDRVIAVHQLCASVLSPEIAVISVELDSTRMNATLTVTKRIPEQLFQVLEKTLSRVWGLTLDVLIEDTGE